MVDLGIISAPRKLHTLDSSIRTLREAGYIGKIHVFSEPGYLHITDARDIQIIIHQMKKGAFSNYNFALNYLLKNGGQGLICILQDDYIYQGNVDEAIEEISRYKEDFGYFNLFTNSNHPTIHKWMTKEGWNPVEIGWHSWGVGYIFRRDILPDIMEHPLYEKTMVERNQQIDGAISEICLRKKLKMFYHNPSFCYSIGFFSTLGHGMKTDGYNIKHDGE